MGQQLFIFGAAFLGSAVESTEALTIVLAVGLTRGWREPLLGTLVAIVSLAVLVILFGQLIVTTVPESALKLLVGTLLLLFGLRWLRKSILRASGHIALHDEDQAFAKETAHLLGTARKPRVDWLAGLAAFKAVLLEGIEVVFIVIAIGAAGGLLLPAGLGAGAALLLVVALGLVLHRPVARIPENQLKFAVGVLLAAFGTFWVGEGIGLAWPGGDWSILALIGGFLLVALLLTRRATRPAVA